MIQRVTLDIAYDPNRGHRLPEDWDWHELLDLSGAPNDTVQVVKADDPREGDLEWTGDA